MLHPVTVRALALAACGWLLAIEASALTLGRPRGAILVGRPVEISIPVTLDAADGNSPCAEAELAYGDQRTTRPPAVRWEPGPDRQGTLRISSPLPVDEPVVTLSLRVGCATSITRSYVLLADLPSASEPSAPLPGARAPLPVPQQAPVATAAPRAPAPAAAPQPRSVAPPTAPATARSTPPRVAPATAGAAPSVRQRMRAEPAGTESRLRLELSELGAERDPTLRLTSELSLPGAENLQARFAAAALWQALQRTPEEALQEAIRLQALDRDLPSLRSQTQQNAAAVVQMRQRVEQARSERNQAAYLIAFLLLLLAGLTAWLLWRWRQAARREAAERWFEPQPPQDPQAPTESLADRASDSEAAALMAVVSGGPAVTPPARTPAATAAPVSPIKPAAVAKPAATPPAASPPPVTRAGPARRAAASPAAARNRPPAPAWAASEHGIEFQPSQGGTVRMVGVQELLDVQDKVEFFLSINQPDQAIALLESHVHDQVETSALPWLDLLELYHSRRKRAQYDQLRYAFIQRFTAEVPDFEQFDQPTSSLENYGRALSRIVALWPSRRVLEVIEESIFRKPGLPGGEPFSLEAYRELVLLYHIAREVAPPQDSSMAALLGPVTGSFPVTDLDPLDSELTREADSRLSAFDSTLVYDGVATIDLRLDDTDLPLDDHDLLLIPPSSPRIGVDVDLGETPPPPLSMAGNLSALDFDISACDEIRKQ